MARVEEAVFLYHISLDGVTLPVYARKSEEKTMKPLSVVNMIRHGIPTSVTSGTMYSDYLHGLTEVLLAKNYIFVEAIEVPIAERQLDISVMGINTIKVKYENGTKITLVEDPFGVNENQIAIDQIKAHVTELEKRNAVKTAFVKPREPEAEIEIEENEMPKVVVRFMGRNTLRNFVKFFGTTNWQYKEEGGKAWLRTPLGWEPLVDGMFIVQYRDDIFGTFTEDDFAEAYGQHSMWMFDEEGLAKAVINKQGFYIFGGSITTKEQKEFEEAMKVAAPIAVATTEPQKEVKSTHLTYSVTEGGDEIEGYELFNNKTGYVEAKFYDEALAKRVAMNLNREDKTEAVISQINSVPSDVTISASQINIDNAKCTIVNRVGETESRITQVEDTIRTKVCNAEHSSSIKQSADSIVLNATKKICLNGEETTDDVYENHRKAFTRNGAKLLFSYMLKKEAPQLECVASLQHEIVHMLTREGYAETERDFTYLDVPVIENNVSFRLKTSEKEFLVDVVLNEKSSAYELSYFEVADYQRKLG